MKPGCKIRVLTGCDEDGQMNATIITPKDVDYQLWYPGRNKVIYEYKNMKHYHTLDYYEGEGKTIDNKPLSKVYDLRTPKKLSSKLLDSSNEGEKNTEKYLYLNQLSSLKVV